MQHFLFLTTIVLHLNTVKLFYVLLCFIMFVEVGNFGRYIVISSLLYNIEYWWFGLVSLFNGISTLFRLFNAKAILLENGNQWQSIDSWHSSKLHNWSLTIGLLRVKKMTLLEEQLWYFLTNSFEDKGVHTFPKGICPKVNVIARLEYELAYYDSVVHRFYHYTTRTLLEYWVRNINSILNCNSPFHLCSANLLSDLCLIVYIYITISRDVTPKNNQFQQSYLLTGDQWSNHTFFFISTFSYITIFRNNNSASVICFHIVKWSNSCIWSIDWTQSEWTWE